MCFKCEPFKPLVPPGQCGAPRVFTYLCFLAWVADHLPPPPPPRPEEVLVKLYHLEIDTTLLPVPQVVLLTLTVSPNWVWFLYTQAHDETMIY